MTQVPSKIFDYISTGKPIINFYYNEKSPTLYYLDNYPLCISIKTSEDPIEVNKKIKDFVDKSIDKTVSFDFVQQQFKECTPSYIASVFINDLNDKKS